MKNKTTINLTIFAYTEDKKGGRLIAIKGDRGKFLKGLLKYDRVYLITIADSIGNSTLTIKRIDSNGKNNELKNGKMELMPIVRAYNLLSKKGIIEKYGIKENNLTIHID